MVAHLKLVVIIEGGKQRLVKRLHQIEQGILDQKYFNRKISFFVLWKCMMEYTAIRMGQSCLSFCNPPVTILTTFMPPFLLCVRVSLNQEKPKWTVLPLLGNKVQISRQITGLGITFWAWVDAHMCQLSVYFWKLPASDNILGSRVFKIFKFVYHQGDVTAEIEG